MNSLNLTAFGALSQPAQYQDWFDSCAGEGRIELYLDTVGAAFLPGLNVSYRVADGQSISFNFANGVSVYADLDQSNWQRLPLIIGDGISESAPGSLQYENSRGTLVAQLHGDGSVLIYTEAGVLKIDVDRQLRLVPALRRCDGSWALTETVAPAAPIARKH